MEEDTDTQEVKRRQIEVMIFSMARSCAESGDGRMDVEAVTWGVNAKDTGHSISKLL